MCDEEKIQQLAELFTKTFHAHHTAFIEVDGADPDWSIWYAEHLQDDLNKQLNASMTKSELVYLLVTADKEQSLLAPGSNWARYYARFFLKRYP